MRRRKLVIKLLALISLYSFINPALIFVHILAHDEDVNNLINSAFHLFMLFAGFALPLILLRKPDGQLDALEDKRKAAVVRIILYLSISIPVLCSVLLFDNRISFFESIFGLIFYLIGLKGYFSEYDSIFSMYKILGASAVLIVTLFLSRFIELAEYEKHIVNISFYVFVLSTMMLLNQNNLDFAFQDSTTEKIKEPENVRAYNVFYTGILFVIMLITLNLSKLSSYISKAGVNALWFLLKLFSPSGKIKNVPDGVKSGSMKDLKHNIKLSNNSGLLVLLLAVVVFIFLIKYQKKIIKGILWILKNLFNSDEIKLTETSMYVDETDEVEAESIFHKSDKNKDSRKRSIFRLRRIHDPVQKIRYIYGLILDSFVNTKVQIKKSDTSLQIYDKSKVINEIEQQMHDITCIYNDVRYGNKVPDENELEKAEKNCVDIVGRLKA